MAKRRPYIYLYYDEKKQCFTCYGIDFWEFRNYISTPLENLLQVKGECFGKIVIQNFEFLERKEIMELSEDDYRFGVFSWVDVKNKAAVEALSPQEIAELLYFGHLLTPLHSPFFEKLDNRFAYWTQDDGWYMKLFCRNNYDFLEITARKTESLAKVKTKSAVQREVMDRILAMARQGVLIEGGQNAAQTAVLTVVGVHSDMDDLYQRKEALKAQSLKKVTLHYAHDGWDVL